MQHAPVEAQVCSTCAGMCIKKDTGTSICIITHFVISAWPALVAILAEGAIALSVTHSGGVLFAS